MYILPFSFSKYSKRLSRINCNETQHLLKHTHNDSNWRSTSNNTNKNLSTTKCRTCNFKSSPEQASIWRWQGSRAQPGFRVQSIQKSSTAWRQEACFHKTSPLIATRYSQSRTPPCKGGQDHWKLQVSYSRAEEKSAIHPEEVAYQSYSRPYFQSTALPYCIVCTFLALHWFQTPVEGFCIPLLCNLM